MDGRRARSTGVHPPETAFDATAFLEELSSEGIEVRLRLEERFT
jgi:hypothetical protein